MECFVKEQEFRRLQLEKELAIGRAEEKAIKQILQEDELINQMSKALILK